VVDERLTEDRHGEVRVAGAPRTGRAAQPRALQRVVEPGTVMPAYGSAEDSPDRRTGTHPSGECGRPDRCVIRCSSVMSTPSRDGTRTPAGTTARSGVSRRTSARTTASASSSAVNVFVTEPISNSAAASTGRPSGRSEVPRPTTVVSPLRASTTPSASPTCRRAAESAARVRTSATLASMSAPLGEGVGGVDALPAQRRERDRVSEPTSGRAGTVSATVPRARSRIAQ
jgi:hypothetical protein